MVCIIIYFECVVCVCVSVSVGGMYLQRVADSRQKIAHVANPFIRDGTVCALCVRCVCVLLSAVVTLQTILTHSRSRVVYCLLKEAMSSGKRIKVFITASTIDNSGYIDQSPHTVYTSTWLTIGIYTLTFDLAGKRCTNFCKKQKYRQRSYWTQQLGIHIIMYTVVFTLSSLIFTCLFSFIMEHVDLVIVGAEGVAESGGIINKVAPRFSCLIDLLQFRLGPTRWQ